MTLQDKLSIYNSIIEQLETSIKEAQLTLQNTIEARNNESKSTAGDKYETGRAMMQIEQQQNEIQLNKLNTLKVQLLQIKIKSTHQKVTLGSLIKTNFGAFFIAIPFGKITFNKTNYHIISSASPLGQMMLNKKRGASFNFMNKACLIEELC